MLIKIIVFHLPAFLEFVPASQEGPKFTDDGYPMGYYHRLKSFERGGNMPKHS